jgi:hypothetical protein
MRVFRTLAAVLCLAPLASAQLTKDQKVADFMQLASVYAKNYGPYEFKRDLFGIDLYNLKPWLVQVNQSKTDLEFYDVLARYVGALQSGHDLFLLPTDYSAWLHLGVDVYDGKVLIDGIDRTYLSRQKYPFAIGDELVSVDGIAAADWIKSYLPYSNFANPVSRNRSGAGALVLRIQEIFPAAAQIPADATVVVQRQAGATETYTIPWDKSGTPIVQEGPVQTPMSVTAARMAKRDASATPPSAVPSLKGVDAEDPDFAANPWGVWTGDRPAQTPADLPLYAQTLQKLRTMRHRSSTPADANSIGTFSPLFGLPTGFRIRLGRGFADEFVSGTFVVGTNRIGFIRIPSFVPFSDVGTAEDQFLTEVAYFQANTDALIVDVMNNPGGDGCYAQDLASFVNPNPFRGWVTELRATQNWVFTFSQSITFAEQSGAPQYVIDELKAYLKELQQALSENRGRTGPLPLCSDSITVFPPTDAKGNNIAYTKPLMILTDGYSVSSAELFTMMLQDAGRATVFGARTDGDTGTDPQFANATTWTEGTSIVSVSITPRSQPVQTPGFPATQYYEGIGIYPDVVQDYLTKDNLLGGGKSFVAAFSTAITGVIQKAK